MASTRIRGTGSYVPDEIVTNDDLAARYGIETDDAWIVRRTGIHERRFAPEGVGTTDLALPAARAAIEAAGVTATDLDLIVFCTLSPDRCFPGSGVLLQDALGLCAAGRFIPAIDVRNQCAGFLYGLSHAHAVIQAGMARHVLLVGAELQSAALDLTTRGRAVASLFGDGAGAVVLTADDAPGGVRAIVLGADGSHAGELQQPIWDTRRRPFVPTDADGNGIIPAADLWAHMNGQVVFKHAVERMIAALHEACARADAPLDSIDLFCFHQANLRINHAVQEALRIPDARVAHNIERYGNTTSASIPLLLDEAARDGRLSRGDRVACVAFGSGFVWGAAIIDW
ncbi:MAG TPA: beta-ketoacyl-ACP synthase 3 [Myxococcota bacterium]|nr:beta-ketoacyl-ACP synthase 3 [Myxococcota bacterium]